MSLVMIIIFTHKKTVIPETGKGKTEENGIIIKRKNADDSGGVAGERSGSPRG